MGRWVGERPKSRWMGDSPSPELKLGRWWWQLENRHGYPQGGEKERSGAACLNRAALERGRELTVSPCPCLGGRPMERTAWEEGKHRGLARRCTHVPQRQVQWEGCLGRAQRLPDLAEAPQPGRDPERRGLGKGKPECAPGDSVAGAGRTKCLFTTSSAQEGPALGGEGASGCVPTALSPSPASFHLRLKSDHLQGHFEC